MPKFDNLKICNSDPHELEDGKWVPFNGVQLKIAIFNNKEYLQALMQALAEGIEYEDAVKKAMSIGILKDWKDFFVDDVELDEDDEEKITVVEIKHTPERALTVLKNDKLTLDFVMDYCRAESNYIKSGRVRVKKK